MTSNSSKSIPFLVLAIVIAAIVAEGLLEIKVDLETYIPILAPMGVGGAALASVKAAAVARKQIPADIEALIKAKLDEIGK